ncbi:MAG: hypothetical protein Q9M92_15210 [Enterobacterales bacterium]|nr:hypothetical protein [Enterobacterales bacterium]
MIKHLTQRNRIAIIGITILTFVSTIIPAFAAEDSIPNSIKQQMMQGQFSKAAKKLRNAS